MPSEELFSPSSVDRLAIEGAPQDRILQDPACHCTRGNNQAAMADLALRLRTSTLEVSDPGVRPRRPGARTTGTKPMRGLRRGQPRIARFYSAAIQDQVPRVQARPSLRDQLTTRARKQTGCNIRFPGRNWGGAASHWVHAGCRRGDQSPSGWTLVQAGPA